MTTHEVYEFETRGDVLDFTDHAHNLIRNATQTGCKVSFVTNETIKVAKLASMYGGILCEQTQK